MKKTLIALAAVAATSASFAQVALTGTLAMGYMSTHDNAGHDTSGLGMDTTSIDFGITEDLGHGNSVVAHLGMDTMAREAVFGGDATLALNTRLVTFTLGSTKLVNYLSGAGASANVANTWNGWDNRVLSARPNADWAAISFPVTDNLALGFTHYEPSYVIGLGTGAEGTPGNVQRQNLYSLKYASGALKADLGISTYDQEGLSFFNDLNNKTRARASVQYNFGPVALGGGVDSYDKVGGNMTDALISVGVPLGSFEFGANYVLRSYNNFNAFSIQPNGNQNGWALAANYNLSKQTKVIAQYQSWQANPVTAINSTQAEIALVKNF